MRVLGTTLVSRWGLASAPIPRGFASAPVPRGFATAVQEFVFMQPQCKNEELVSFSSGGQGTIGKARREEAPPVPAEECAASTKSCGSAGHPGESRRERRVDANVLV